MLFIKNFNKHKFIIKQSVTTLSNSRLTSSIRANELIQMIYHRLQRSKRQSLEPCKIHLKLPNENYEPIIKLENIQRKISN